MALPPGLAPLFWDCTAEAVDTERHAAFVLERVLEYGTLDAARWALDHYGAGRIAAFLRARGARILSRKTLGFWVTLLGLEGEPCFDRSSLKRSRIFWDY